jgi:hypothetical protein
MLPPEGCDPPDRAPEEEPLEPEEIDPREPLDLEELEPRETDPLLDELEEWDPLLPRDS